MLTAGHVPCARLEGHELALRPVECRLVPRISAFYGIGIWMYHDEGVHSLAHFHARYAGQGASISVDGHVLAGDLPARALRLVLEWAQLHCEELLANWDRARQGEPLVLVAPLT